MFIEAAFTALAALAVAWRLAETLTVYPEPTDEVLYNPHMGFQTFQHFNGDELFPDHWTEVGPEEFEVRPESLENPDHPFTRVAYCRWYWDTIEPAEGEFRWGIIDGALKTARERRQTLAIRVMCHDHLGEHEVPGWFQKCGARGERRVASKGKEYWLPDYSDPLYIHYWTRLNAELAARFDGHADLDTVDLASIGPWGEWDVRPVDPPMWAKEVLIDCYTDNFKKTPLLMQFDDAPSLRYGVESGTGWRADCLGDMGWRGRNWCHMRDLYPQGIVYGGAGEAWKTSPVVFEVCGVMKRWHERGFDADYVFDQAIKWHFSQFNTKSSAVPEDYWPAVERCLKRMGYRFVLRKFQAPGGIEAGRMLRFHTWWENRGCAPLYHKWYRLALRLSSKSDSRVLETDADVTTWMPGDTVYDDAVFVPRDLEKGKYELSVGMIHRLSGAPAIDLAQEGRDEDGWYSLGELEII